MCTKPGQDKCIAKEVPLWWTFWQGVLNSPDDVNKEIVCLEIGLAFSATEEKISTVIIFTLKEVKPSPNNKIINL